MINKIIYTALFLLCFSTNLLAQENITQWQRTGGPLGGDVNEILMTDSGVLIAGTRLGGLYRSSDNGQSWTLIPTSSGAPLLFAGVWDLAKNSQGHLFAGTNRGLYRSTDGGDTWQFFDTGLVNRFMESLAINSSNIIYAGTRSGVFRSEDNGETWVEFNNGLTNTNVAAVAINSLDDVYAGTQSGIFFSDDNGDNWSERSTGLIGNKQVTTIFITPDDSLLAGTYDGLFRSDDYGMNWSRVLLAGTPLSLARSSGNVLIYGSSGSFIHRSIDNGVTWTAGSGYIYLAGFHDLLFGESEELYASSAHYGVLRSEDYGDTWVQLNSGLSAHDVVSMCQSTQGSIFAAASDGFFKSVDGADSWSRLENPSFGISATFVADNNAGRLFAAFGVLMISDDDGVNWSVADTSLTAFSPTAIAFGSGSDVYVSFWNQVFKSDNNGDTWTEISTGLPSLGVQALGVSSTGTVFTGTTRNGVYRLNSTTDTWEEVNNGIGTNYDNNSFLFEANGDVLVTGFDGVYRSNDNGDTWAKMGDVPTLGVNGLVRDFDGNLFIASRGGGVSVSEDNGLTWKNINSGLSHLDAHSLLIDDLGSLYVGTRGGSVLKTEYNVEPCAVSGNFCVEAGIVTASKYLPDQTPDKAFDGDPETNWGGGAHPPQWIQIELFEELQIGGMSLVVDQSPAGATIHQIWAKSAPTDSFNLLHEFNGSTDYGESLTYTAPNELPAYRYFRVLTTASPSWVSWKEITIHKKDVMTVNQTDAEIPENYTLGQNYPNPFNPETKIKYAVQTQGHVSLTVYNNLGQQVRNLLSRNQPAGSYLAEWDGRNDAGILMPSGVYFYRLDVNNFSQIRKLILLR